MEWQLIQVGKTDWIQDNSGYYTLINWIDTDNVRLDVMDKDDTPVISFQGKAEDVRKHIMQDFDQWNPSGREKHREDISYEHAAYIGAELARAELLKEKYIQD